MEHDEVAPVAGLALLAERRDDLVSRLRNGVLSAWSRNGWKRYWWRCRGYVCAQSLEFLQKSGGIPADVLREESSRLTSQSPPITSFETAQNLSASLYLGLPALTEQLLNGLLDRQAANGGWPPSWDLLVPDQHDPAALELYSDDRALMSTAAAVMSMVAWYDSVAS
jgi:hypothetical protein